MKGHRLPKHCPHCGIGAHTEPALRYLFGLRVGGRHAQPWCRACRGKHPKGKGRHCDCPEKTLERHAKRLKGERLAPVVKWLGLSSANKGRYGRAVEVLLGLGSGDNRQAPDWRGVEVKWVPLRRDRHGHWILRDKVFVTGDNDRRGLAARDPVAKIQKVRWVFGDYRTKQVLSTYHTELSRLEAALLRLSAKLGRRGPRYLFRNTKGNRRGQYSYYLSREFFRDHPGLAAHIAGL